MKCQSTKWLVMDILILIALITVSAQKKHNDVYEMLSLESVKCYLFRELLQRYDMAMDSVWVHDLLLVRCK